MATRCESLAVGLLGPLLLLAQRGPAQAPDAATLAVLDRLSAASADYARAIPDFACTEVIHTRLLHKGKERRHADYETEIRVVRQPDDTLTESFTITLFDGKPPVFGKGIPTISYLDGGLSKGLPSFFTAQQRGCYRYTLRDRRMDFVAEPHSGPGCKDAPSTSGFGLLDAAGNLLHGEVRRSAEDARRRRNPTLAALDYTSAQLGGRAYRMPSHLYAETSVNSDTQTTFDAQYRACHLYKVTATILPADAAAAAGEVAPPR